MHKLLRWLAIALLSWIGGIIGMVPVIPLGLGMDARIVAGLALGMGTLLAATVACWAANWLCADKKRTRTAHVLGLSLLSTALLWFLRYRFGEPIGWDAIPIVTLAKHLAMVALVATSGAWHWRNPTRDLRRDARQTLLMVGTAVLLFILTLIIASRLMKIKKKTI